MQDPSESTGAPETPPTSSSSNGAVAAARSSVFGPLPPLALLRAPELQPLDAASRLYWDRSHYESPEAQVRALQKSSTVYVGNLAFTTRSRHVQAFFSQLGPVRTIHMGLDRLRKTPCGFCFVQYVHRRDALRATSVLSGSKLDGNVVRVELDAGFQPGRQYGRGRHGGQVRDDKRALGGSGGPTSHKRALEQTTRREEPPQSDDAGGDNSYERNDDSMDLERPSKRQRT